MKKIPVLFAIVILSACSAKLLTPAQPDADRAATQYPGTTLAQLTEGKQLYENHCGNCHPHKNITKGSDAHWDEVVPEMVQKVNKKAGQPVLDASKQDLILKYVKVMRLGAKK